MTRLSRRIFVLGGLVTAGVAVTPRQGARAAVPYPFKLGVASGDPAPDSVVLWTRLAPSPLNADGQGGMANADVTVDWQVSTTDTFTSLVASGTVTARYADAHSVHAIAGGLAAGRRLLLPLPGPGPHLPGRADPHRPGDRHLRPRPGDGLRLLRALRVGLLHRLPPDGRGQPGPDPAPRRLHLRGRPGAGRCARTSAPRSCRSPTTAAGTRSTSRDPDLQAAHAVAPWLVVPDDHEVENNYANMVRDDNSPALTAAQWTARRTAAYQAYYENMPLRPAQAPTAATASRCTGGSGGAAWPRSTCSTPGSSATTRPAATAGRCAPTPTWPPAPAPAPPRRRGCSTGSPSTWAPGTSSASRCSSPASSTRPAPQHGRLGRLPRLPRADPAGLDAGRLQSSSTHPVFTAPRSRRVAGRRTPVGRGCPRWRALGRARPAARPPGPRRSGAGARSASAHTFQPSSQAWWSRYWRVSSMWNVARPPHRTRR